jgi:hypothetical protein
VQQAGSLLLSGKYLIDGHSRGKNLTAALDNTDIESIKKFWNLTDSPVAKVTSPALSVEFVCTVLQSIPRDDDFGQVGLVVFFVFCIASLGQV